MIFNFGDLSRIQYISMCTSDALRFYFDGHRVNRQIKTTAKFFCSTVGVTQEVAIGQAN